MNLFSTSKQPLFFSVLRLFRGIWEIPVGLLGCAAIGMVVRWLIGPLPYLLIISGAVVVLTGLAIVAITLLYMRENRDGYADFRFYFLGRQRRVNIEIDSLFRPSALSIVLFAFFLGVFTAHLIALSV